MEIYIQQYPLLAVQSKIIDSLYCKCNQVPDGSKLSKLP